MDIEFRGTLMKLGFLTSLLVTSLAAATANTVTIHNWNGSGIGAKRNGTSTLQARRPFSVSRVFRRGEITGYPSPVINGQPLASWQADVKSRWNDGSVQFAIVSFRATVQPKGQIKLGFENVPTRCSAGDESACEAAALSGQQMLAFDMGEGSGSWGACLEVTAGAGTKVNVDARTMLANGDFFYWLRGPVVTQVVARDFVNFRYNFGWRWDGETMQEVDEEKYKSLGPMFILTFYPGWNGVKIDYVLENDFIGRIQDQVYSAELRSGHSCGEVKCGLTLFTHYGLSRWRKTFWDGAAPGDVRFDFNFPYLIETKVLPSYDTTISVKDLAISKELDHFMATDRGTVMGYAGLDRGMQGGDEGGIIQRQDILYLYTMDARMWDVLFGTNLSGQGPGIPGGGGEAAVNGYGTFHYREARTAPLPGFCSYSCTGDNLKAPSVGRVFSIDAYPNERTTKSPASWTVGPATKNHWSFDPSHLHDRAWIPYLITGDYYYLEEMWFGGAMTLGVINPGMGTYMRHDRWGYINEYGYQIRGCAWGLRTMGHAWFFSPDGTPEKQYFAKKIANNIAVKEGTLDLRDGLYAPADPDCKNYDFSKGSDSNRWCWGRETVYQGLPNPLHFLHKGKVANDCPGPSGATHGYLDCSLGYKASSPWMWNFNLVIWRHLEDLGFSQIRRLRQAAGTFLVNLILDPGSNPYATVANYRIPISHQANPRKLITNVTKAPRAIITIPNHDWRTGDAVTICCAWGKNGWARINTIRSSGAPIEVLDPDRFIISADTSGAVGNWDQTVYAVKPKNGPQITNYRDLVTLTVNPNATSLFEPYLGGENTYSLVARSALAGLLDVVDDGKTGVAAWEWYKDKPRATASFPMNPKWAIVPRPELPSARQRSPAGRNSKRVSPNRGR